MSAPPLYAETWAMWAQAYLLTSLRLQKPEGVRLLLDDGTEIPCRCAYEGVLGNGQVLWSATPETGESVPAARLDGVEVDDLPASAVLHLGAKLEGLACRSCGEMTYDPDDAREGYCAACRTRR
ncbi:hypothetical protein AB5J62_33330 [Amycolatopsis sp. cg5]|uniref:hypothetical protein n=1 Tax=Amycolatopsis sp. cg5 TaxID=3238802 RepID=UPI0035245DB7